MKEKNENIGALALVVSSCIGAIILLVITLVIIYVAVFVKPQQQVKGRDVMEFPDGRTITVTSFDPIIE